MRVSTSHFGAALLVAIVLWANQIAQTESQLFDRIMNMNAIGNSTRVVPNNTEARQNIERMQENLRKLLGSAMSVNVPVFYDMTRNGSSSLGINVLSGLVKVERGDEAVRNGLVGLPGAKPLSVRVFGIPVFERGQRVREPKQETIKPFGGNQPTGAGNGPETEEALPI